MNSRGSFREPQILLRDQNKAMSFTSNISNAPFTSSKDIISSITVVRERLVPVHFLDLCDSREPLTLYTCQSVFPHSLGASFPSLPSPIHSTSAISLMSVGSWHCLRPWSVSIMFIGHFESSSHWVCLPLTQPCSTSYQHESIYHWHLSQGPAHWHAGLLSLRAYVRGPSNRTWKTGRKCGQAVVWDPSSLSPALWPRPSPICTLSLTRVIHAYLIGSLISQPSVRSCMYRLSTMCGTQQRIFKRVVIFFFLSLAAPCLKCS